MAFVVLLIPALPAGRLNPSLKKEGLDEVYGNKPYFCAVTKSGNAVVWQFHCF